MLTALVFRVGTLRACLHENASTLSHAFLRLPLIRRNWSGLGENAFAVFFVVHTSFSFRILFSPFLSSAFYRSTVALCSENTIIVTVVFAVATHTKASDEKFHARMENTRAFAALPNEVKIWCNKLLLSFASPAYRPSCWPE